MRPQTLWVFCLAATAAAMDCQEGGGCPADDASMLQSVVHNHVQHVVASHVDPCLGKYQKGQCEAETECTWQKLTTATVSSASSPTTSMTSMYTTTTTTTTESGTCKRKPAKDVCPTKGSETDCNDVKINYMPACTWIGASCKESCSTYQKTTSDSFAPWSFCGETTHCMWTGHMCLDKVIGGQCTLPPSDDVPSATACADGTNITSGKSCIPKCMGSMMPSASALSCQDGQLSPRTFGCMSCANDDDGVKDSRGKDCWNYTQYSDYAPAPAPGGPIYATCGDHDDSDFKAGERCCGCNGGASVLEKCEKSSEKACSGLCTSTLVGCKAQCTILSKGLCSAQAHCHWKYDTHTCAEQTAQCKDYGKSECKGLCEWSKTKGCATTCSMYVYEGACGSGPESSHCEWSKASGKCLKKIPACAEEDEAECKNRPSECMWDTSEGDCKSLHGTETECEDNKYLMPSASGNGNTGTCLGDCPPGFLDIAGSNGVGGVCKPCLGKSSRRRVQSCDDCQNGYVAKDNSDECQNVQDTCSPDQCKPCRACMSKVDKQLAQCVQNEGADSYNPGTMWCSGVTSTLLKCQSASFGCWYTVLCHAKCVDDKWKEVFCGGITGDTECPAELMQIALAMNASALEPASLSEGASLDESLSGKRTAGSGNC